MNSKHTKTLQQIFHLPTVTSLKFSDIESLIVALGGSVHERAGSRVRLELNNAVWRCHRPHPGNEAKRYQVEEAREFLQNAGVMR